MGSGGQRALAAGKRLGGYELVRSVDETAHGVAPAFLARRADVAGEAFALVKVASELDQPIIAAELQREATLLAAFDHPCIVCLFEAGQHEGLVFIAREVVNGPNLRSLLATMRKAGERLPIEAALHVGWSLLEALAHLHDTNAPDGQGKLVHLGIRPRAVAISRRGEVKLCQVITATARAGTATPPQQQALSYLPPEQALGSPGNARSDIFAAFLVLHEALCGEPAYGPSHDPGELRDLPPKTAQLIARGLAGDPGHRYSSARLAADAIAALLAADPEAAMAALGQAVRAHGGPAIVPERPTEPPSQ